MVGRPDRGAGGELNRRTYATRSPSTIALSIGADALEALVVEAMLQRLDKAAIPAPTERGSTDGEVEAVEAELGELAELRGAGTISLAEWMAARAPLQERLEAARRAAAATRRPGPATTLLSKRGAVRAAWPALDFDQRREVLAALVDRVVVKPAARARHTPTDARVDVVWRA
jgi:hypothetical protein